MSVIALQKHSRAREAILDRIRTGHYRPGQKLPSERELALDLSLSHMTVRKGLGELVHAGVIVKKARVGNFVQPIQSTELAQRIAIVLPRLMHDQRGSHTPRPHPVTSLLMSGILGELDQRDCALSILSYDQELFWHDAGESMLARGIKGAIVYANADTPVDQMAKLAASRIKVVLINGIGLWPELRFPSASIDLVSPIREAIEHLTSLGHRHLALVSYEHTRYQSIEQDLVNEFARRFSLDSPDRIIFRLPDSFPRDYGILSELFDRRPMPTAMILQDEFIAHEIFRQCHDRGVRVPDDLSLVAIADSAPQSHLVPLSAPNTSALWIDAARKAAQHLKAMLETTESLTPVEMSLHGSIQWKQSTSIPSQRRRPQ
jgi:DNA-binding LacI/PurR family transcriptional regulator